MPISITKKAGPFFPEIRIGQVALEQNHIALENSAPLSTSVAQNSILGERVFKQPAVFKLASKLKEDGDGTPHLGTLLGWAAMGAMAMASSRWRYPMDEILEMNNENLWKLSLMLDPPAAEAVLEGLFAEAKTNPVAIFKLDKLAAEPTVFGADISPRLQNLDISAWKEIVEEFKEDEPNFKALYFLSTVYHHPGAKTMLRNLDLSRREPLRIDNKWDLLNNTRELREMAELGNPSAWEILGESDIATLENILEDFHTGNGKLENAKTAMKLLLMVARSGGPKSFSAIQSLRQQENTGHLIENLQDIPDILDPLLKIDNASAKKFAEAADLNGLKKLPNFYEGADKRRKELFDAIAVVLKHSQCKESLKHLVDAVEQVDPEAFRVLNALAARGYSPAKEYLKVARSNLQAAMKSGHLSDAVKNLIESIFKPGSPALGKGFKELVAGLASHPKLQPLQKEYLLALKSSGSQKLKRTLAPSIDIARGILSAWETEPYPNYYLRQAGKPMGAEMIPSSYIDAYVERSLRLHAVGNGVVHDGPTFEPGILEQIVDSETEMSETPQLSQTDMDTERERGLLEVKLMLRLEGWKALSREQKNAITAEILEAWKALSPSDQSAYPRESWDTGIPDVFILSFEENRSALFRPWSESERGKDVERDPRRSGPKGGN